VAEFFAALASCLHSGAMARAATSATDEVLPILDSSTAKMASLARSELSADQITSDEHETNSQALL
jgi:hypothetical protein